MSLGVDKRSLDPTYIKARQCCGCHSQPSVSGPSCGRHTVVVGYGGVKLGSWV